MFPRITMTILFSLSIYLFLLTATSHAFVIPKLSEARISYTFELHESAENVAEELRKKAEKLRKEVASFEQEKEETIQAEKRVAGKIQVEKEAIRERYSAEVPILKGDGNTVLERIDFPPRIRDGNSYIETYEASLPLGILLGESEDISGLTVVDEVAKGSNGENAGVQVGDIVRAFTSCQTVMKTPTWQILVGGIGMPETKRMMYNVDGRPFEEVMEAIGSNRMDPEGRPVILVVERKENDMKETNDESIALSEQ